MSGGRVRGECPMLIDVRMGKGPATYIRHFVLRGYDVTFCDRMAGKPPGPTDRGALECPRCIKIADELRRKAS